MNKQENQVSQKYLLDTGRKLNVHKTFRRRPGRLLNVLCTFNLRPARKWYTEQIRKWYHRIPLDFPQMLFPLIFVCSSYKSKIYIIIHIRLCKRVSEENFSPGRFPETKLLFFMPKYSFYLHICKATIQTNFLATFLSYKISVKLAKPNSYGYFYKSKKAPKMHVFNYNISL